MTTELKPIYNRQKSFYGKATVSHINGKIILTSYTTEVCSIDENGHFHRLWNGYSVTTMNHINEFRRQNGLEALSKKEWLTLPTETENRLYDRIQDFKKAVRVS